MLTSTFKRAGELDLKLPKSTTAAPTCSAPSDKPVELVLTENGTLLLDGAPTTFEKLPPYAYGGHAYYCHHPYYYRPYAPMYYGPAYNPWGVFLATMAATAIIVSVTAPPPRPRRRPPRRRPPSPRNAITTTTRAPGT